MASESDKKLTELRKKKFEDIQREVREKEKMWQEWAQKRTKSTIEIENRSRTNSGTFAKVTIPNTPAKSASVAPRPLPLTPRANSKEDMPKATHPEPKKEFSSSKESLTSNKESITSNKETITSNNAIPRVASSPPPITRTLSASPASSTEDVKRASIDSSSSGSGSISPNSSFSLITNTTNGGSSFTTASNNNSMHGSPTVTRKHNEEVERLNNKISLLQEQIVNLLEEKQGVQEQMQKQAEHYLYQIKTLTEFSPKVAPTPTNVSSAADKAEIANLNKKLERKKYKITKLKKELEDSKNLVDTLQSTINEMNEMRTKESRLRADKDKTTAKYHKLAKDRKKKIKELQDQITNAMTESVEAQNELAQQKQELDVLRKILQESNSNPSSIISPNDKKPKKKHKKEKSSDVKDFPQDEDPIPVLHPARQRSNTAGNVEEMSAHVRDSVVPTTRPPQHKEEHKMTLTVYHPDTNLTLTTQVLPDWTIQELVRRIQRKLPDNKNYCALFLKIGKSEYVRLDEAKLVSSYKQLEDPKAVLEYTSPDLFFQKDKKRGTLKKLDKAFNSSRGTLPEFDEKVSIFSLIKDHNVERIESALQSDPNLNMDELNNEGDTPLSAAIKSNNPKIVSCFLKYYEKNNLDINVKDRFGWSALHFAVSSSSGTDRDEEVVRMVLNFPGIIVDCENEDKNTPLHYFCQKYLSPSCTEVGSLMIEKAPLLINHRNKNGESPLHKAIFNPAVRILMCKLLVNRGADVNVQNTTGDTALHYSVRMGRKDLVKILLHAGADINIRNANENKTAYELANSTVGQEEIAEVLKGVKDLAKWLEELDMSEYFLSMIREDVTLETLALSDETRLASFMNKLKINAVAQRLKFKRACEPLQEKLAKQTLEAKMKKASAKRRPSFEPSAEQQHKINEIKKDLQKLIEEGSAKLEETWLIRHNEIEFTKEIGMGTSGRVYKGLFQSNRVAIKVFKSVTSESLADFKQEFLIMSVVRSPHIITFYGACLNPTVCMVTEYCARGSLFNVLKTNEISWARGIRFATDITKGMVTFHTWNPVIFHRDMKSPNVLITKDWDAKVADMGLARFNISDAQTTMQRLVGTYSYLAPEVFLAQGPYTEKADVFSMGIIFWEIAYNCCNGEYLAPYAEYKYLNADFQIALHVSEKNLRPTVPPSCIPEFAAIIRQCVLPNPEDRPTSSQVLQKLLDIRV